MNILLQRKASNFFKKVEREKDGVQYDTCVYLGGYYFGWLCYFGWHI